MSVHYRNTNTDEVVKYDKPDARLDSLDNWEKMTDEQVEKLGDAPVSEPVQFSQIGEVSEDGNLYGAGTQHSDEGLNADKDDKGHADGNNPSKTADGDEDPKRPTDANKVEEIDGYAAANEIDLGGAKTKAEKLALIDAWHNR